jgi:hypothetical protein
MNRKDIHNQIAEKQLLIQEAKKEIQELNKQDMLLSDDQQWFTEKMETIAYREGRKKVKKDQLVGRIHWIDSFQDEYIPGPDGTIKIERCQVVRIDGNWSF